MKCKRNIAFTAGGIVLAAALIATDLLHGCAGADAEVMTMLRLPRIITAVIAGCSLALAGTQMQAILRNPLADPHIMGVSSGAALGAALATMSGTLSLPGIASGLSTAGAAFAGALATGFLIMLASRRFRTSTTLLIFGVMLGFIVSAITTILQFSTDAESLKSYYSWAAGSFSITRWQQIAIMAAALAAGLGISFRERKGLDIILFGDEYAKMAGADTERIKFRSLLSSCIVTGAVTAFCGPLGFIGIISPHIAKAILKTSSHRIVIPAALLVGGIIGIAADLISQLSRSPLPVASTMAIVGIPVVLYILISKPSYGE